MKTITINYQDESYIVHYDEETNLVHCEPYHMAIEDTFIEMLEDIGTLDQDYFLELLADNATFNVN
jgi:hypothetical protein